MANVLGIVIIVAAIAACAYLFVKTFMTKRAKAKNPCASCVYHECRMTHGVCDRLNKDGVNLK